MKLKVFTKIENPEYEDAINVGKEFEEDGYDVEYLDLDQTNSQQLAQIFDIYATPAFVVTQNDGKEVSSWRGNIPARDEIKNFMRL
jgi:thioredoxin-related protein